MNAASPHLVGKTISLRIPIPADYPELQALLNDREVMVYLQSFFQVEYWTDETIQKRYAEFAEKWKQGTALNLVVVKDHKIIGNAGLKNISPAEKTAEFGIILDKSVWGSGVSKECHVLVLDYAFATMGLKKVSFNTDQNNVRMRGFFKKHGVRKVETKPSGMVTYEIFDIDWPKVKESLTSTGTKGSPA